MACRSLQALLFLAVCNVCCHVASTKAFIGDYVAGLTSPEDSAAGGLDGASMRSHQQLFDAQGTRMKILESRLEALERELAMATRASSSGGLEDGSGVPQVRADCGAISCQAVASRLGAIEKDVGLVDLQTMSKNINSTKVNVGYMATSQFRSADCVFMMGCCIFTMLMTLPGLALFYGGLVRLQNVLSTVMQTFCIACLITVLWVVIGYSLCFSPGNSVYGDTRSAWLASVSLTSFHSLAPHVPEPIFVLYQLSFAILTPAVICGSFADRMRFFPMLVFMTMWHLLVYCPLAHIMWTDTGFLHALGILDFAGGNVVHVAAGVCFF